MNSGSDIGQTLPQKPNSGHAIAIWILISIVMVCFFTITFMLSYITNKITFIYYLISYLISKLFILVWATMGRWQYWCHDQDELKPNQENKHQDDLIIPLLSLSYFVVFISVNSLCAAELFISFVIILYPFALLKK